MNSSVFVTVSYEPADQPRTETATIIIWPDSNSKNNRAGYSRVFISRTKHITVFDLKFLVYVAE